VREWNRALENFLSDFIETFEAQPGGIGMAAPQVGHLERIVLLDVSRKQKAHGRMILINPVITEQSGSIIFREGCMSLPDFTANVRRSERVKVQAFNEKGNPFEIQCEGLEAVCIQHEIDHLEGKLFIHRVANLKTDVFRRKRYLK
jgi:peptide deformylase